jgi:asparagine synthase (glutamine-hydrolysing)
MPVFEKQRFQRGAVDEEDFDTLFPADEMTYRQAFREVYA